MKTNNTLTIVPASYPELADEQYRQFDAHERETEVPPPPSSDMWELQVHAAAAIHRVGL